MRLLLSADLHLGSPIRSLALRNPDLAEKLTQASRDALREIVDLAIAEHCDALVLAGDIFDRDEPDMRLRSFFLGQLSRASEAGIPTVLIRGNHDALLDHRSHGELGANIHLLRQGNASVEIGEAVFHGLSFTASRVNESMLPGYPAPVPGRLNVGLMHTSLGGAPGHDAYAPCSVADLVGHGYDLWALGHIHKPMVHKGLGALLVMPGIPQPRDFGERHGGYASLVDLTPQGARHEHRRVGGLAFREAGIDLDDYPTQEEAFRALCDVLSDQADSEALVAVRLNAVTSRYPAADLRDLVRTAAEGLERVFVDKVRAVPPTAGTAPETDDLLRLMLADMTEPGMVASAREIVEDLANALPADLRSGLREADIAELLRDAVAEVHLHLHRGGRE